METNVNPTNSDTDFLPELGSVGGLAVVTKAGDVGKGSMGLGAESTPPQHIPSMSLNDSHKYWCHNVEIQCRGGSSGCGATRNV
jgi:hypothetical protein